MQDIYSSPLYRGRNVDYITENFSLNLSYIYENIIRGKITIYMYRRTREERVEYEKRRRKLQEQGKCKKSYGRRKYKKQPHEIFVWVPGYRSKYAVSQFGTVIAYEKDNTFHLIKWKKNHKDKEYRSVDLYEGDKKTSYYVHRLVAAIYCTPWYSRTSDILEDSEVHHWDKDPTNNAWWNLLLTPREYHTIFEKVKRIDWKIGKQFYVTPFEVLMKWNYDSHPLKTPNGIKHATLMGIAESIEKAHAEGQNPVIIKDSVGVYRVAFHDKKLKRSKHQ